MSERDSERSEHPAVTFLRQWENGDSARGTEQCPDCGRFPYEGHRVECQILAIIFGLKPTTNPSNKLANT